MTYTTLAAQEITPPLVVRGTQVYPDYKLDGSESMSRYRHVDMSGPVNYYALDPNLRSVLDLHVGDDVLGWAQELLTSLGARCGGEVVRRAETYDRVGHELERYDRFGRDVSRVVHHPEWLANRDEIFDFGAVGWNHDPQLVERYGRAPVQLLAAFDYLVGQADMAICCPLELAHGTVAVLERFGTEDNVERFLGSIVATDREQRLQVAQVATEITGGSGVGASRTEARGLEDRRWVLNGEKWFASNCSADLILTLGRVDPAVPGTKGLGMFVVPRVRRDGSPNGVSIRRLKDKMGTIGVPTGELIFNDAEAELIGDAAEGWRYMAEMLNHTRFWNAVGSLGVMRRAFLEAASYAAQRRSFGTTIDSFPMVRERLVWLHVDLAATTALMLHCAQALEETETPANEAAALRFRTLAPVVKYRAGEHNIEFARAAIETLGGNGYINTFGTPRLLRDAHVNTIWEGTSNICALDLQRAIAKQDGHRAVFDHMTAALERVADGPAAALTDPARHAIAQTQTAINGLADAPTARREQQARRLADLFGDAVAIAAMGLEADHEARQGDYRKALTAELFIGRRAQPADPAEAITHGWYAIPDMYPTLFGDQPLGLDDYTRARARLAHR
jgi:alkylation response protein AidB-like acyl-CoA dehydrogenase